MNQENRNEVDFIKEKVRDVLDMFVKHHKDLHDGDLAPWATDLNGLANSIANSRNWDNYYKKVFRHNKNVRQYLFELCETRNQYSHRDGTNEISDEDVFRTAHTATRLLNAINSDAAMDALQEIREIEQTYGGRRYGNQVSDKDSVPDLPAQETVANNSKSQIDMNETQIDAPDIEEKITITEGFKGNTISDLSEPTSEDMVSHNVASADLIQSRDASRDNINRRYMLEDSQETPEQVVEREFPRLNEPVIKDEATRENKAIRGFDKPKRSQYKRPKKKRPYTKLPEIRQRTPSNSRQRSRPRFGININSNNQQVTYERGSKDPVSETQNRNVFILVASVISILIVVPLMPELLQANPSAWLLVLILILVIYKAYQRWLEHQEDMKRMEIELNRKSIFQRVKGFFGR